MIFEGVLTSWVAEASGEETKGRDDDVSVAK
jgi:hypothetical protein